jgi:hypothetical protein
LIGSSSNGTTGRRRDPTKGEKLTFGLCFFFFNTRQSSPTTRVELIISRVIIMAELISRRRQSLRAGGEPNKQETEALSSFDCRDTSAIVLTAAENAILEASKEYAVSAGNLVRVLTTHLGNDRSSWSKDSKFLNCKPHLRDWWLEVQWKKIQKQNALKVLKCTEEQLLPTMKGHMRIPCTKELEQSDPGLFHLLVRTRRCINWFLDKLLFGHACSLHQVRI